MQTATQVQLIKSTSRQPWQGGCSRMTQALKVTG